MNWRSDFYGPGTSLASWLEKKLCDRIDPGTSLASFSLLEMAP